MKNKLTYLLKLSPFFLLYTHRIDLMDKVVLQPKTFRYNLNIRIRPFYSPFAFCKL